MRNLKKVLALVIAFSMMLSVVAFANYADVDKDASYAGAVEVLSALKIFEGDDLGNFNPDNTITRAEAAAVVVRALGLENSAQAAKGTTVFSDVAADNWASGYVNIANQNGIVNGRGDGTFAPNDTVTYEQFVKMIVCALGFEPMASQQGGWPTGYLVVANKYKITSGVSGNDAARKTIAQIVYNAISTPKMDQTSFGTEQTFEVLDGKNDRDYATLLTDRDIYIATGVVGSRSSDKVSFKITDDSDDFEFKADKTVDFNINGTNIMDYKNQNVDVYVYKNSSKDYDVLAVVPSSLGETLTIVSDDVKGPVVDNKLTYYTDSSNSSKTKTVKLSDELVVEFNTVEDAKTINEIIAMDDVEITLVENDGNSEYDVVIATDYFSGRVDSVEVEKDKMTIDNKIVSFDFDDEDIDIILTDVNGAALELSDFEEDDVVAVVSDADNKENFKNYKEYIKIINLGDSSVTGTVGETYVKNGDNYVSIDGKGYIDDYGLALNDEGTFYIGITGRIIDFDGSAASKNYAYFLECASESKFGKTYQVKLLTEEDGVVTFDLSSAGETSFKAYATAVGINVDDTEFTGAHKADYLVTYKTNASGELKSIEKASADADKTVIAIDGDYKASSQKLNGKTLEDDVIIFNVDKDDADDVYTTDISYLVDETSYKGFILKDDGDYTVVVLTEGAEVFSSDYGFAIATGISYTQDADDQDVVKVTYVQDGEEGTVTIDDDSKAKYDSIAIAKGSSFDIGSVFVFNANSNGVVSSYAVLGDIDSKGLFNPNTDVLNGLLKAGEVDDAFYYGYIDNTERDGNKKGETITVNGQEIYVSSDANKYTYNDSGRNTVIENGDFMAEDVYYKDTDKDGNVLVSYVFIRVIEGDVVDIYSFNERSSVTADKDDVLSWVGSEAQKNAYDKKPVTPSPSTTEETKTSADSELEDVAPVVPEVVEEETVVVPDDLDPVVVED